MITAALEKLEGLEGENWVFFVRRSYLEIPRKIVIFFPGDLSTFAKSEGNVGHCWESLLWMVSSRFPISDVILICPSKMFYGFAVYRNFSSVDKLGNPNLLSTNNAPPKAFAHLAALLRQPKLALDLDSEKIEMTLIGFSKGGVVLSGILRDIATYSLGRSDFEDEVVNLWKMVTAIHFLDCGLNVPGVTFNVGAVELVKIRQNSRKNLTFFLHGTSRQIEDSQRPHIGDEFVEFYNRCVDASIRCFKLFYPSEMTLEAHFKVLEVFETDETYSSVAKIRGQSS